VRDHNKTLKFDKRYSSCKLDDVCKQELGAEKTGFTYEEIFKAHETKDPITNTKLVEYNIQDCNLVLALQGKLQIILGLLQLSEISLTPVQDVVYRGVTCRVMNMLSKKVHIAGYYLNHQGANDRKDFERVTAFHKRKWRSGDGETPDEGSSFQGAHCFPVITGVHTDNVLGVDYASLYPSIIRRYNIDPTMLVLSPTTRKTTRRTLSDGKDDFATFIVDAPPAPVPALLTELTSARRVVKRQMKNVTGTEYAVLNKRQLALKTMSNSCYGFMGCSNSGGLGHPELAAAVTAYGRDLIRGVAAYVIEEYPGAVIVGGDSVTGDTPLLVKLPDGSVDVQTIETLGSQWTNYCTDKEQSAVDANVWSEQGWTKVVRVIRHETSKQLYRICTHTGFVDVTEDHSLLLENGVEVKPGNVAIGTKLLHSFTSEFESTITSTEVVQGSTKKCSGCGVPKPGYEYYTNVHKCKECYWHRNASKRKRSVKTTYFSDAEYLIRIGLNITKEEAFVWGFFFADGSCGAYQCPSGMKRS
jgi:hypothetical protein